MDAPRTSLPLDQVDVASPCSALWEEMKGDERVRHCALCELNVYNLSAMTREEASRLILEREGRLCVRFFRRADGTLLTADCPRGVRAAARWLIARTAAAVALIIGLTLTAMPFLRRSLVGSPFEGLREVEPLRTAVELSTPFSPPIMGVMCPPPVTPPAGVPPPAKGVAPEVEGGGR